MQGFKSNYETLYDITMYIEQHHKEAGEKALSDCGFEGPFDDVQGDLESAVYNRHEPAMELVAKIAAAQGVAFHYIVQTANNKEYKVVRSHSLHRCGNPYEGAVGWYIRGEHRQPFKTF